MSGFTRATILFSLVALVLAFGVAYFGLSFGAGNAGMLLCTPPLALLLSLSVGYLGAYLQKDDPAKTARNTRNGARSGLIVAIAALVGRVAASFVGPTAALGATDACLALVVVGLGLLFGGIGGWSWARHEHEVRTGYKPT